MEARSLGSSLEMETLLETKSSFVDNIPTFIFEDKATNNLFSNHKLVQAVNLAEGSVGFHHMFVNRGPVTYHDLNKFSAEDLSSKRGDVFMSNLGNEMNRDFKDMAEFAQKKFKVQLLDCVLSSVSVMKVDNIKVHCDDEGVGKHIVIFNCSDEEYDLSFYDKSNKNVFIGKLAVKSWMTYLLANEARLAYHAVENATHLRSIVRLGFLETSSIHDYLLTEYTEKYPKEEKTTMNLDGQ